LSDQGAFFRVCHNKSIKYSCEYFIDLFATRKKGAGNEEHYLVSIYFVPYWTNVDRKNRSRRDQQITPLGTKDKRVIKVNI
jgi:hypothetical protein